MSTQSISGISPIYNEPRQVKKTSRSWIEMTQWLRRTGEVAGIICLVLIVLSVVFAGNITPYSPTAGMDLRSRFIPPFWESGGTLAHPLGTDNLGRDVLARTLHGGKISLKVALIASTISTFIGAAYGLISGYMGGTLDRILQRINDISVSFPFLVLALAVIAAMGSSTTIMIALLSLAGWVYPARVTRAQTLKIREYDFVHASEALGASRWHIIRQHIIPNIVSINIVIWTFLVSMLMLIEGSLSFLGLGVAPPTPSWGNMLAEGRSYLQDAWWLSVFPGLLLTLTIICVNSSGDILQRLNSHGEGS
jgi:ABC-type dipeptide/oligopeptide/nickel transport system permease subunit